MKKLNDLLAEYGTLRDGIRELQAQEKLSLIHI